MPREEMGDKVEALVAKVTPQKLASLVYTLEPQQHEANRGSVAVDQIIDQLLREEGYDLTERAHFEVALRKAILHAVKQIPEMEFVDGG